MHKPFTGYYYNFFLSFKKYNRIVADKAYSHQFCSFLNYKLKNCATFYFVDHLDNLFFDNYEDGIIFNFFISSKNAKVDWTLDKYFWGQTKKYKSYYIELDYKKINEFEIKKGLFFFNLNSIKSLRNKLNLTFLLKNSSSKSNNFKKNYSKKKNNFIKKYKYLLIKKK